MTIEERLTRLEQKNRRLTLALVLVVLTTGSIFTVRMCVTGHVPNEVIARSFRVVNAEGKVIACLGVGDIGEPVLRLRCKLVEKNTAELTAEGLRFFHNKHANSASLPADEFDLNENPSVMLIGSGGIAELRMWDEDGKDRVMLSHTLGLNLHDENGKRRATLDANKDGVALGLYDENGKERAGLSVLKGDPSLDLSDENGKERVLLMVDKHGPDLSLYDQNGKTRAMLMVDKDGTRLSLRDENGKGRAALCVLKDGPNLLLSDKNGKTRVRLEEDRNGASLDLFTKNHELPTIMLYAAEMSHPDMTGLPSGWAAAGISPDNIMYGSGLQVNDEDSRARARLNINKDGADFTLDDGNMHMVTLYGGKDSSGLALSEENGNAGAVLSVDKHGPDLRLYDDNGKTRGRWKVTKTGPALDLLDKDGKVLRSLP